MTCEHLCEFVTADMTDFPRFQLSPEHSVGPTNVMNMLDQLVVPLIQDAAENCYLIRAGLPDAGPTEPVMTLLCSQESFQFLADTYCAQRNTVSEQHELVPCQIVC